MERVRELKESRAVAVSARTEKGYKYLKYVGGSNPDLSGQGDMVWEVYYYRNEGEGPDTRFGPMDSKELSIMHPELFWHNTEIAV